MAREPVPVQQQPWWQQVLALQAAIMAACGLTITVSGCRPTPGVPCRVDVEVQPATSPTTVKSAQVFSMPATSPVQMSRP